MTKVHLNFKLSNEKAQFVTREHDIKHDIKPYVINHHFARLRSF